MIGTVAHNAKATRVKSPEGKSKTLEISISPPKGFDRSKYHDLETLLKTSTQKMEEKHKNNKKTDEKVKETPRKESPAPTKAPTQDTRLFDNVKPIERPPIPRNQAVEKGMAHLEKQKQGGNSLERAMKQIKKPTALTSIQEEDTQDNPKALEDAVIDKYLAAEIPMPLEVLAKLSPSFRRKMIRQLQLREIK